jgi:hypothetical protein
LEKLYIKFFFRIFNEIKMVMTRKELLEYTRSEKLDKLFLTVSQMDTLAFESVEQLESLVAQKTELERELGRLDERLAKLNEEK